MIMGVGVGVVLYYIFSCLDAVALHLLRYLGEWPHLGTKSIFFSRMSNYRAIRNYLKQKQKSSPA